MVNQDENGIRYTMFRADSIDADLLQELLYTHGKDLSYAAAVVEETARQRAEWEQRCEEEVQAWQDSETGDDAVDSCFPTFPDFEPYLDDFDPMIDEPITEGVYQDVHYRTTWLGGALHLWIFKSPMIGYFDLCSPCVPNACNGDQRSNIELGSMGYDVPPDWRHIEPDDGLTFLQRLEQHE